MIKLILFMSNNIKVNMDNTVTTPYKSPDIWIDLSAVVFAIIKDKHALTVGINRIVFVNIPTLDIYLYANILGYLDLYYVLNISYRIKHIFIEYNKNINIKYANNATPPIDCHIPLNYMN